MGKGLHTIGICAELLAELFPESEPILERNIGWREGVRALRTCVSQCHTRAEELEMGKYADLGLGAMEGQVISVGVGGATAGVQPSRERDSERVDGGLLRWRARWDRGCCDGGDGDGGGESSAAMEACRREE